MNRLFVNSRVDLKDGVTSAQIVQDASLVQNGEIGHVFFLLKLRRIAFQYLRLWKAHSLDEWKRME